MDSRSQTPPSGETADQAPTTAVRHQVIDQNVLEPSLPETATESLTLRVGDSDVTFPVGRIASVGAHRFCDVVLDDPDGELPHRAAVFAHGDTGWTVRNDCTRHLVLHNGDDAHRVLAPRARTTLRGCDFVLSVPGTGTTAEVEVRFGQGISDGVPVLPWLEPACTPLLDPGAFPDLDTGRHRTGRAFVAAATVGLVLAAGAASWSGDAQTHRRTGDAAASVGLGPSPRRAGHLRGERTRACLQTARLCRLPRLLGLRG